MICSSPALPMLSATRMRSMSFSLKALFPLGAPTIIAAVSPSPESERTMRLLPVCFPVTLPLIAARFVSAAIGFDRDGFPEGNSMLEKVIFTRPEGSAWVIFPTALLAGGNDDLSIPFVIVLDHGHHGRMDCCGGHCFETRRHMIAGCKSQVRDSCACNSGLRFSAPLPCSCTVKTSEGLLSASSSFLISAARRRCCCRREEETSSALRAWCPAPEISQPD